MENDPRIEYEMGLEEEEIEENLVAYLYFLVAATKGHPKSQYIIGKWCYDHDRVGDALSWFTKSALQGDILSMYYLGEIYQKFDIRVARKWYTLAATLGHSISRDKLDD